MPGLLFDPEHWRARALEARSLADHMLDKNTREAMLDIAKTYERLAAEAQRRIDESIGPKKSN
jgi:hypothetical protein